MKKTATASRSSLFLMELISSILILSLCTTVCIRIFAASWEKRRQAREYNHMQELLINTAEILKATDGDPEFLMECLPDGVIDKESILYYYDSAWKAASSENARYEMVLTPSASQFSREIHIQFLSFGPEETSVLYETTVSFPVYPVSEEGGAA